MLTQPIAALLLSALLVACLGSPEQKHVRKHTPGAEKSMLQGAAVPDDKAGLGQHNYTEIYDDDDDLDPMSWPVAPTPAPPPPAPPPPPPAPLPPRSVPESKEHAAKTEETKEGDAEAKEAQWKMRQVPEKPKPAHHTHHEHTHHESPETWEDPTCDRADTAYEPKRWADEALKIRGVQDDYDEVMGVPCEKRYHEYLKIDKHVKDNKVIIPEPPVAYTRLLANKDYTDFQLECCELVPDFCNEEGKAVKATLSDADFVNICCSTMPDWCNEYDATKNGGGLIDKDVLHSVRKEAILRREKEH